MFDEGMDHWGVDAQIRSMIVPELERGTKCVGEGWWNSTMRPNTSWSAAWPGLDAVSCSGGIAAPEEREEAKELEESEGVGYENLLEP